MPRRQIVGGFCALYLLQLLSGCGGTWRTSSNIQQDIEDQEGWAKVRITLSNSRTMVIRRASVKNGLLIGEREQEPDETAKAYGYYYSRTEGVEIPLAEIKTLQVYEDRWASPALQVGGVMVLALLTVLALGPVGPQ